MFNIVVFRRFACLLLPVLCLVVLSAGELKAAAAKKSSMLVEPTELAKNLKQEKLRIVDTRPASQYIRGHIPGAISVNVGSWKNLGASDGGFRNKKAWSQKVGELGISADSHVVVYGNALPNVSRIWWLLKYVGVKEVSILNGGWPVWMKEKGLAETETPSVATAKFEPKFQFQRLSEIDALKKSFGKKGTTVVDTRSRGEFTGRVSRGKRGGHIPGATHLDWVELMGDDGRLKTLPELKELFAQRGFKPEVELVCY